MVQAAVRSPFEEDSAARGRGQTLYSGKVMQTESVPATASTAQLGPPYPHVHHSTASRVVKGEDVLFVHPLGMSSTPQSLMYLVCDGHTGVEAANFVATHFLRHMNAKLPPKLPTFTHMDEVHAFATHIRKALVETFVQIDNDWSQLGHFAGTTVTVLLTTGWLLTVANTGDSAAVLDTGASYLSLTKSHRIESNLEEQARLRAAAQHLAPLGFHLQGPAKPGEQGVGPLRLWPGGLCVSRSIGDLDAGPEVVPVPHVRQLLMPVEGCRVIMASDGLWDVLSFPKALKLTRSKPTGAAASALITAVSRDRRTLDDTSIVVIDMLPSEGTSFPTVALRAGDSPLGRDSARSGVTNGKNTSNGGGGLFSCFKPEVKIPEPDCREVPVGGYGHVSFLCDLDCLAAEPTIRNQLQRTSITMGAFAPPPPRGGVVDYTLHGAMSFTPGMNNHAPPAEPLVRWQSHHVLSGASVGGAMAGAASVNPSLHAGSDVTPTPGAQHGGTEGTTHSVGGLGLYQ